MEKGYKNIKKPRLRKLSSIKVLQKEIYARIANSKTGISNLNYEFELKTLTMGIEARTEAGYYFGLVFKIC